MSELTSPHRWKREDAEGLLLDGAPERRAGTTLELRMNKPDLTAAPYGLDETAIAWVRTTIDAMTEDQKVGQLFVNLNNR
jgi:hypothetical protein